MRKTTLIFALIFFSISIFGFGYKYEKTIEKSFKAGTDYTLELENCNGNIEILTTGDTMILIKAEKYSNKEDAFNRTEIIFKESGKKLKIYVKRPDRNCKASVRFAIRVPHNLSMTRIETVNGSIELDGSFRDIKAGTVNGKLSLEGSSKDTELETVNGSIDVYLKKSLSGDIHVETVNGSAKLELERNSSFNLSAETVNGSIKTDYNISATKKFIGSEMEGSVNQGKYDIKVKTVNGSIKILKN